MRPHRSRWAAAATVTGAAGSLACTLAMTTALAGAFGAGAATGARAVTARHSMPGMATPTPGGPLGGLIQYGPQILALSALLVTAGLAPRRPLAAVPGAAAGVLLWWGMYAQANLTVMYTAVALAYPAWTATWLWARHRPRFPTTGGSPCPLGEPSARQQRPSPHRTVTWGTLSHIGCPRTVR